MAYSDTPKLTRSWSSPRMVSEKVGFSFYLYVYADEFQEWTCKQDTPTHGRVADVPSGYTFYQYSNAEPHGADGAYTHTDTFIKPDTTGTDTGILL